MPVVAELVTEGMRLGCSGCGAHRVLRRGHSKLDELYEFASQHRGCALF